MKKKIISTLLLMTILMSTSLSYVYANDMEESHIGTQGKHDSAMLEVMDYLNKNANSMDLPDAETPTIESYEIPLEDGEIVVVTITLEKIESAEGIIPYSQFPVNNGESYVYTIDTNVGVLGASMTHKIYFTVLDDYDMIGFDCSIDATPPNHQYLYDKDAYFVLTSGMYIKTRAYVTFEGGGLGIFTSYSINATLRLAPGLVHSSYTVN